MKRSRDWPPTSKERSELVPYGVPRKLLRLDEGPYVDVWTNVVRQAVREHRMRWKRMGFFGDLHRELYAVTRYDCPAQSYSPPRVSTRRFDREEGLLIERTAYPFDGKTNKGTVLNADLVWRKYDLPGTERLAWALRTPSEGTTRFEGATNRAGLPIIRYTTEHHWTAFMRVWIQSGNHDRACQACARGKCLKAKNFRQTFLRMAPKQFDVPKALAKMEKVRYKYF